MIGLLILQLVSCVVCLAFGYWYGRYDERVDGLARRRGVTKAEAVDILRQGRA